MKYFECCLPSPCLRFVFVIFVYYLTEMAVLDYLELEILEDEAKH